jgi:hypothetical protein
MPTITVVKDTSGYVFGCYTPEPWRVAPRFYGSGETFVFQLEVGEVRACTSMTSAAHRAAAPCLATTGNQDTPSMLPPVWG